MTGGASPEQVLGQIGVAVNYPQSFLCNNTGNRAGTILPAYRHDNTSNRHGGAREHGVEPVALNFHDDDYE
ncbi:uncharacterized protein V6R79_011463 [Siganus canaliculatus]